MKKTLIIFAILILSAVVYAQIRGNNSSFAMPSWGSASLDYGATLAGTCEPLTVTVTGAQDGDVVEIGIPHALANADANGYFKAWVSSANTVTISRCNRSLLSALSNPAAATVKVSVVHW